MSTDTGTQTADLVECDLADPAGEALYRQAHADVEVPSKRLLLGDRHGSRTADEDLAFIRGTSADRFRVGTLLDGGRAVGWWGVRLPLLDNLSTALVWTAVTPDARRRGHATRMLAHAERLARDAGRTVLQSWQMLPIDDGTPDPTSAFAARHGYTSALPSLRNDLDLVDGPAGPDGPPDLGRALGVLDAEVGLLRDRLAHDYRLVTFWDQVPDEHLVDRAHLMQRMSTDAPTGDLTTEEERWDGERVREHEQIARAQGRDVVETCALHVPSGRLVAFTQLSVPTRDPRTVYQWDTLVLREHRGLRLGMWIKAANLRHAVARYPQVRRLTTFNAASNAPMLRVNRAMGFRAVCRETCFEKRL